MELNLGKSIKSYFMMKAIAKERLGKACPISLRFSTLRIALR